MNQIRVLEKNIYEYKTKSKEKDGMRHLIFNITMMLISSAILFQTSLIASAHDPKANLAANKIFSSFKLPSTEKPQPIGSYAKGCMNGGVALPVTGPTWQVIHPKRNRNWGHPTTVSFVKRLSVAAKEIGWAGLYIGDISQPRGGPMPYGHKSHQTGLDVDIWLTPAEQLDLNASELEKLKLISIRTKDMKETNSNWTEAHIRLLKAVALDDAVDRVFITAPAKINMCRKAGEDRSWLQKIRPMRGHHRHIHIRLRCPNDSVHCTSQRPTIEQISQSRDGCDHTLEWWVTTALQPYKKPVSPPKKTKPKKNALSYKMDDLPVECKSVIHNP